MDDRGGGRKGQPFTSTAKDGQQLESRNHQIEEVARLYGVPRPLLMMDDTSWGSGIEQLAIFFVQFTMTPRFTAWEQALARALLTDQGSRASISNSTSAQLLRGTLKDQADYFAKALGAGGHRQAGTRPTKCATWLSTQQTRIRSSTP